MTGSFVNSRNRDYSAPRVGSGNSRPLFGTMGGNGPSWTDSMPRRDFYSNVAPTGSLPRRDKAGLGRPEPGPAGSKSSNNNGIQPNNSMNGGKGIPPPTRRRESSLSRDNTSSFGPSSRDKRNSTGNLYFSDSLDGGPDRSEQSDLLARLSNNIQHQHSSLREDLLGGSANGSMTSIESTATLGSSTNDIHGSTSAVSAELRTAAGDLGKELKNLITMMDQEEAAEAEAASGNTRKAPLKNVMVSKVFTTNSNKESPV